MAQYTILADSITGIQGKLLLKGDVVNETEFITDHIPELITNGSIRDTSTTPTDSKILKKTSDNGTV